jgi:ferredoxin
MPTVQFLQDDLTVTVAEGSNLGDVATDANALIPFSCRDGTCGTCIIEIKRGRNHLTEPTEKEKVTLAIYGGEEGKHRLACQCRVHGDVTVDLP